MNFHAYYKFDGFENWRVDISKRWPMGGHKNIIENLAVDEGRFVKTVKNELTDVCMDRWIRRVDGRMDGWTDGVIN